MRRNKPDPPPHKETSGGIKIGYAGFVPGAAAHHGSSHVGGLPYRDGNKWNRPPPPEQRVGRLRGQAGLNVTSAREPGRQAWNMDWVGKGQLLSLLTPADLAKYKLTDKVGVPGRAVGIRNLEAGCARDDSNTSMNTQVAHAVLRLTQAQRARAPTVHSYWPSDERRRTAR